MGRVRSQRANSVASGTARHRSADRRKAPYKVVFEEVTRKKKLNTYLSSCKVPPKGYTFIPAGDMQLTKRCKSYSKFFGMTIYIVSTSAHPGIELSKQVHRIGYHFSIFVVDKACESLGVTLNNAGRVIQSHFAYLNDDEFQEPAQQRPSAAKKSKQSLQRHTKRMDNSISQAVIDSQAREAIMDLFPNIPPRDLHEIVSRAFDMNSAKVGTAENTSLVLRANLAVVAHIRHVYTNYDLLLKIGMSRPEARRGIEQFTLNKLVSWRGDEDNDDNSLIEEVLREVVVISDDEEELDKEGSSATRGAPPRNGRDGNIPSRVSQTPTVDLTILEDEDESEDEISAIYEGKIKPYKGQAFRYDREKEARMGHERHSRWEQAIKRQKQNPVSATNTDVYNASFDESGKSYSILATNDRKLQPIPGLDGYNRSIALGNQNLPPALEIDVKHPTTKLIPVGDEIHKEGVPSTSNPRVKHPHQNVRKGAITITDKQLPNAYYRFPDTTHNITARVPYNDRMVRDPSRSQPAQSASSADKIMPSIEGDHFEQRFTVHNQTMPEHSVIKLEDQHAHEPKRRRIDEFHHSNLQNPESHVPYPQSPTVLIPLDGPEKGQMMHSYPEGPLYKISSHDYMPILSQSTAYSFDDQGQIQRWKSHEGELPSQNVYRRSTFEGPQMAHEYPGGVLTHPADRDNSSLRSPSSPSTNKPRLLRLPVVHDSHTLINSGQKVSAFHAAKPEPLMHLSTDTNHNVGSRFRQLSISGKVEEERRPSNLGRQLHAPFPPEDRVLGETNHRIIQMPSQETSKKEKRNTQRLIRLGQADTLRNETSQQASPRQIILSHTNPFGQSSRQQNLAEGRNSKHDLWYQPLSPPSSTAFDYYDPRVPNTTVLQKEHVQANRRRQNEVIVLDG